MSLKSILEATKKQSPAAVGKLLAKEKISFGQILMKAGELADTKRAIALLRAAMTLKPPPKSFEADRTDYLACINLASVLASQRGDWKSALELIEPYLALSAENPYLGHTAACALTKAGRNAEALAQVQMALAGNYAYADRMETDADLDAIRKTKAFKAMFDAWRADKEHDDDDARYHVDLASLKRGFPKGLSVPPLLSKFATWLAAVPHGTLGYFDGILSQPFGDAYVGHIDATAALRPALGIFLHLPDGTDLALWSHTKGKPPAVVMLGSEGELENVAPTLEAFLRAWVNSATGVADLDEEPEVADYRPKLAAWLDKAGVEKRAHETKTKAPSFKTWFDDTVLAAKDRAEKAKAKRPPPPAPKKETIAALASSAPPMLGKLTDDKALVAFLWSLGLDVEGEREVFRLLAWTDPKLGYALQIAWPWHFPNKRLDAAFPKAKRDALEKKGTRMLWGIELKAKGYEEWNGGLGAEVVYQAFPGPLPYGIAFSDRKSAVKKKVSAVLGAPRDEEDDLLWYDPKTDRTFRVSFEDEGTKRLKKGQIAYIKWRIRSGFEP